MKVKIVLVLGVVNSAEVANNVLMNVCSERLRGPDLVIGGCVEVEDPS